MAGSNWDPKVAVRIYGVVMVGVWAVLGALLLVLSIVRLVQGRFRDAAIVSIFAIASFGVAAWFRWWHRRQLTRTPRWARDVPAEVLDDPQRRFDLFRRTWQARAWSWAMVMIGIAGGIWAISVGRLDAVIACVILLIGGLRLLQRLYFPRSKPG